MQHRKTNKRHKIAAKRTNIMTKLSNVYAIASKELKRMKSLPCGIVEVYSDDDMIIIERVYEYSDKSLGVSHIVVIVMKRHMSISEYVSFVKNPYTVVIANFSECTGL